MLLKPIFAGVNGVSKISVFMYFDYREYLRDVLDGLNRSDAALSMRALQESFGVRGSAFFARILDGTRPLSLENAGHLAASLKLNGKEAEYFKVLVKFGNEKNVDKREPLLRTLIAARAENKEYALQDSALDFFSKWYVPVLRDLLPLLPADASPAKTGRMFVPALKASQVENAIEYLKKNGFVHRDPDGKYAVGEPLISTPPRVRSTILRKYHLKNLEIDREVYDAFGADERSVSSVTCSLSKESFEKVRLEIQNFRERVLAISREDRNPSMVCHLGLQLLPRTKGGVK